MRILDVSPRVTLPLSSGSRIRIYNLLSRLSQCHEIRQFSQTRSRDLRSPGYATDVRITPSYLEHRHRNTVATPLCEMMETSGFGVPILCGYPLRAARPRRLREWMAWADVVIVEFPWQYACCRAMSKGKPLVLSTHNVQAAKARSDGQSGIARRLWSGWTEALERDAVRGADMVLAVRHEDGEEFALRYGLDRTRIRVIPNGADVRLYQPADEATRRLLRARLGLPAGPLVLFPAPHRQTPILAGLAWVRRVAALLPSVTFLITGAVEERPKREANLLFTGFVQEYESYVRSADCMLCPIDRGGGTKLKLIEAAAAGLPIVAFPESVQGTTFLDDDHLLVADKTPAALADALGRILHDPHTAERLGAGARAHAVEHYDWDVIARIMETELMRLTGAWPP